MVSKPKTKLLLLPGMDGSGELFDWLIPFLEDNFEIHNICYPKDIDQSYDNLTCWLYEIIKDEEVFVLGESFSGPIAITLAAKSNSKIKGLILVSSFANPPISPIMLRLVSLINFEYIPFFMKKLALLGFKRIFGTKEKFKLVMHQVAPELISSRIMEVANCSKYLAQTKIDLPLLILEPEIDLFSNSQSIIQRCVSKRNLVYKSVKSPHMLLQTNPEFAANEIIAFARKFA